MYVYDSTLSYSPGKRHLSTDWVSHLTRVSMSYQIQDTAIDTTDDEDDVDDGDNVDAAPTATKRQKSVETGYATPYHEEALSYGFWLTTATVVVFAVCSGLILAETKANHYTVSYYLNGDRSVNGDTFRGVSFAYPGTIIGGVLGLICWALLLYRKVTHDNDVHFFSNAHQFNAWIYFPVQSMKLLLALALMQTCGLAHLWSMIYTGLAVGFGGFLLTIMRLEVSTRSSESTRRSNKKLNGSSALSVFSYIIAELSPYCIMAAAVAKQWPGDKLGTAFILAFCFVGVQVLFSAGLLLKKMLPCVEPSDKGWFRWVVLRTESTRIADRSQTYRKLQTYSKNVMPAMWWCCATATIAFLIFTFETQLGFNTSARDDRGGRNIYERITWLLPTGDGETVKAQFDRTWAMGQYFVPFIFGLPMLLMPFLIHLQCRKSNGSLTRLEDYWCTGRDPYNEAFYGAGRFMLYWMLLNITGTTEFHELFLAGLMAILGRMLWAEARKDFSLAYMIMAMIATFIPLVHAAVNYASQVNQSNVELAAVIVLWIMVGVSEAVTFAFYIIPKKKDGVKELYRVLHPDTVVVVRLLFNWAVAFAGVISIYSLGGMHQGYEIDNPL